MSKYSSGCCVLSNLKTQDIVSFIYGQHTAKLVSLLLILTYVDDFDSTKLQGVRML